MTPFGPYTPVRHAGNFLFVSGQVGVNPDTKEALPDVAEQFNQALENLKHLLEANGTSLQDVVKTTVFLTNMNDFAVMNSVYDQVFKAPYPARSAVSVAELPRVGGDTPIKVEIEAVVYKEKL